MSNRERRTRKSWPLRVSRDLERRPPAGLPEGSPTFFWRPLPALVQEKLLVSMAPHELCTVTAAADVPDDFKALATAWPLWDSKTHPQKPRGSGKFRFDYNGTYASERVLIMSGAATLKPTDGSPSFDIKAGDAVTFWNGFSCDWRVTKRMTKHYAYYSEDGKPEEEYETGIACDMCSADCFAESYLFEEMDICPTCFKKDEARFEGAEHQKEGEAVPAEQPQKKRKQKA